MSRFQLLSDAQWDRISDLMPGPTGKKGRPFADARTMVEGIIYRYRCGIAWRELPEGFGPWQTVDSVTSAWPTTASGTSCSSVCVRVRIVLA